MIDFGLLDFNEIEYYCKSERTIIPFSALPSFIMIQEAVMILSAYGINQFSAEDIRELFLRINVLLPSGKVFKPSCKKISGVLDTKTRNSVLALESNDGTYSIKRCSIDGYKAEIKRGYEMGYITKASAL